MPVLKYQRSMQQLRNTKMNKNASRAVLLIFVFLNLVLVMSLSGCAANCQSLKEEPRVIPLETVLDFNDWQLRKKNSSMKLKEALSSATKIIDKTE